MQSMLYNVAENIIRECGEKIDDAEVISTWMDGAVKLLTLPSVAPDLQEAASGFMVALGCCPVYCNAVSLFIYPLDCISCSILLTYHKFKVLYAGSLMNILLQYLLFFLTIVYV